MFRLGSLFEMLTIDPEKRNPLRVYYEVHLATVIMLLIIHTADRELYRRYTRHEATDLEVADAIMSFAGLQRVPDGNPDYEKAWFESRVIVASQSWNSNDKTILKEVLEPFISSSYTHPYKFTHYYGRGNYYQFQTS